MKNIKTFEKFNKFNKLNEHAWMQNMRELEQLLDDDKNVLFITQNHSRSEYPTASIEEVVKMSREFDAVVIDSYLFVGGDMGGLKPNYIDKLTIIAVDDVDDLPNLPNHIKLGTVGYNL